MLNADLFGASEKIIPPDCDVILVADLFVDEYVGGAELTTQALLDSVPDKVRVHKIKSSDISMKTLESGYQKFWIFTNFAGMDLQLIPSIIANLNYSIVEYDYKFCKYRSPKKHEAATENPCDCHEQAQGNLVSTFYFGAKSVFFMSEAQKEFYYKKFPFLNDPEKTECSKHFVLSSVFDDAFFVAIKELKEKYKDAERSGYLVLGSDSWIKGTEDAIKYCNENGFDYKILKGLNPYGVLDEMAKAKGFVYLPRDNDTCPRMVIEAQLLGCDLHLNEMVQHHSEYPFTDGTLEDIEIYLYGRRELFWNQVQLDMNWNPKISGYTTTYNCISQKYPFRESIRSMLGFCEEVVVMDGGSDDGTWDELKTMAALQGDGRLKIYQHPVDWNGKRFAVEDGLQKGRARSKCTLDFCWQQDSDEIVHENDYQKIFNVCRQFPKFIDIVSLPVIEFWGSAEKVRMDVNPWKWRVSRNKDFITHGIPKQLRKTDEQELLYASLGTDGCDYIHNETFEMIPHATFYTQEIHELRIKAIQGNAESIQQYQSWFDRLVELMPCVYHYSWFDIERKIKTYKNYWQNHWESLYDIKQEDTADNNMFFDKPWKEVSDEEIAAMADRLSNEMGGWIFHSKVDFNQKVPHLKLNNSQPKVMFKDGK